MHAFLIIHWISWLINGVFMNTLKILRKKYKGKYKGICYLFYKIVRQICDHSFEEKIVNHSIFYLINLHFKIPWEQVQPVFLLYIQKLYVIHFYWSFLSLHHCSLPYLHYIARYPERNPSRIRMIYIFYLSKGLSLSLLDQS